MTEATTTANGTLHTPQSSQSDDSAPNISFKTHPTFVSGHFSTSRRSEQPWENVLEVITTPTLFKNVLLRTLPWDGLAAYPLRQHQLTDDIPVVVHDHKIYYLRPDLAVLDHDPPAGKEEANTFYNQLFYRPDRQESPSPFVYANPTGDFFLPLGSLVEAPSLDTGPEERLTNYVWALNISTDPVSLWLVFDYVTTTPNGEDSHVRLGNVYWNQHNELDELPYTYDEAPVEGYLKLGGAWDLLKVFDDVERDWQPENVVKLDGAERRELGPSLRAYALKMPPKYSPGFRTGKAEKS
ncbi:MAG: hypothetical protein Q9208_002467 [Pyrenodesmia sp. 3 TL-2023]